MSARGLNVLVFREGRRRVYGLNLKRAVLDASAALAQSSSIDLRIAALLRAGELECGVADTLACSRTPVSELTDRLSDFCVADSRLDGKALHDFHQLLSAFRQAPVPEELAVSTPEGFAYYAVHPLAYADALGRLPALSSCVVVVGIRSIGTTLS